MKQMWKLTIAVVASVLLMGIPSTVMAQEKEAGATASLFGTLIDKSNDLQERSTHLQRYLESKNSPLADNAKTIVSDADRLGLDWKLVAAIAGTESYFGRHIPQSSYNAWGWAIFTGQADGKHFDGWEDGIHTVSEGIKQNYVNRGFDTVEKMGPIYAADPYWAGKVNHFMAEIDQFQPNTPDQLAIAL